MAFREVIISSQCKCSYKAGFLVVRQMDKTIQIHLSDLDCIVFETTSVMVSGYLLSKLAQAKVAVLFCDEKHMPVADVVPRFGAHNMSQRLEQQISWSIPSKKQLWKRVVQDKIHKQAEVLSLLGLYGYSDLESIACQVKSGDSTNREGVAAHLYFPYLFGEGFTRDILCSANDGLNYGYQILLGIVAREISARGYLTQSGIQHHSIYNQFNFACDLMEPFRPIVDMYVATHDIGEFDSAYRVELVKLFEKPVAYCGGAYKAKSVVSKYVEECLRCLNREIKPGDIHGYQFLVDSKG